MRVFRTATYHLALFLEQQIIAAYQRKGQASLNTDPGWSAARRAERSAQNALPLLSEMLGAHWLQRTYV